MPEKQQKDATDAKFSLDKIKGRPSTSELAQLAVSILHLKRVPDCSPHPTFSRYSGFPDDEQCLLATQAALKMWRAAEQCISDEQSGQEPVKEDKPKPKRRRSKNLESDSKNVPDIPVLEGRGLDELPEEIPYSIWRITELAKSADAKRRVQAYLSDTGKSPEEVEFLLGKKRWTPGEIGEYKTAYTKWYETQRSKENSKNRACLGNGKNRRSEE